MIIILNISAEKFSLNGIPYFKNFMPHVLAGQLKIVNVYDSTFQLTELDNYSNYSVDGVVYGNVVDLQNALLPVLYTRNSLNFDSNLPFYNQITKQNGIESSGLDKTFNAGWEWLINNIQYSNASDLTISFPLASSGKERLDRVVATNLNTFIRIPGQESDSSPTADPRPDNTVDVTFVLVTDSEVDEPTPPIVGDEFITKVSKSFFRMFYTGHVDSVPVDDKSYLKFEEGMLSLKSLHISDSGFLYHGRDFIFKNGTSGNVTLYHMQGTGNFRFNFSDSQDLIIKPEECVHIVMRAINVSNNGGLLDLVGRITDLSNYYTKTEIDSKISTVLRYKGNVANYAALPSTGMLVGDMYNTTDTGHNYAWTGSVWDDLGPAVDISGKQDSLVSGTNIKTVNGTTLLGSGNLNTPDMDTTTAQEVSGVKTFRNLMLGLRNAANTFTSFFTNTNTASRTYTLQNKSGTIAHLDDITSVINPGTVNRLPKYTSSTGVSNSRVIDDGANIGIETIWPITLDFLFGYLKPFRTFGIEDSISTQTGKDLIIRAGRSINFDPSGGSLIPLGQTYRQWRNMCCNSSTNDVFACANGVGILKQVAGAGDFIPYESSSRAWYGVSAVPSTGTIYACVYTGDIYKQTNGTGSFVALGQTIRNWTGISCNTSNGNVYACVENGGIFMQTAGTGNFVSVGAAALTWFGIAVNSSTNDVYAVVQGGDIYKQTAGTGSFIALGGTSRQWRAIYINNTTADVYACDTLNIYKQTAGTGVFTLLGVQSLVFRGVAINSSTGDFYASVESNDIYFKINNALGSSNLDGGTLKHKAGTGKGTGKSRQEFYTGQKTVSGTDMQVETLRAYFDENGFFVYLTAPIYANDAAADADTNLPSKAFYKVTGSRTIYQKP